MDAFEWTKAAEDAAQMVADGDLSYDAIAKAAGTVRTTLRKWRDHPEFQARVEELRAEYREHVRRRGIAIRENRLAALDLRHRLMMQLLEERGADPRMADVPGGKTGLLVITDYRTLPGARPRSEADSGEADADEADADEGPLVPIVEFDAALVKAMCEHEKQTAQDLGQWTEKKEVSGANGRQIAISVVEVVVPGPGGGGTADADADAAG